MKDLTETQIQRYARHILLPEIGGVGQARLLAARVLVVGAGGLGSPLLLYLAAAGVGTLGIIDDDFVDLSNLQRQILHGTPDLGRPKVDSARDALLQLDPALNIETYQERLTLELAMRLVPKFDLVADGSDNFTTRYALNDACYHSGKPLISAALLRFEAQISVFKAYETGPCYRCLFPKAPPPDMIPSCSEAGILGMLAGTMGALQATEIVKEILQIGESLSGSLLIYDALAAQFQRIRLPKDPGCLLCRSTA